MGIIVKHILQTIIERGCQRLIEIYGDDEMIIRQMVIEEMIRILMKDSDHVQIDGTYQVYTK